MSKAMQYREFDQYVRDSIRDPKDAAEYLSAAAEDGDNAAFLLALKDVLDVHGSLSELSRKTGLNRANLHRMLQGKSSPRLDTLTKLLNSAGLRISIMTIQDGRRSSATKRAPARAFAAGSARDKRGVAAG
jgi:probable addiction module antidote protein